MLNIIYGDFEEILTKFRRMIEKNFGKYNAYEVYRNFVENFRKRWENLEKIWKRLGNFWEDFKEILGKWCMTYGDFGEI